MKIQAITALTLLAAILCLPGSSSADDHLITDLPEMTSEDGTFEPASIQFDEPVSWSGLPAALMGHGINPQVTLSGSRAPQVDEFACGMPPEADNPFRAMITPDGAYAVTAFYLSDNIGIQNLSTAAWVQLIDVGAQPVDVDITPSGSHALITCSGDNTVVAVNLGTYAVDHTIPVGSGPVAAAVAPDGSRAVVLNSDDASASIIELTGWTVERTVSSPAIYSGAVAVLWNTLGSFLYEFSDVTILADSTTAVVPSGNVVNFVNLATGSVTQVAITNGQAVKMAVTRDGTTLAVASSDSTASRDVNFIDLTQMPPVVTGGFDFGGYTLNTKGITFNEDGSLIAVAHYPTTGGYTYLTFYNTTTYSQVYQCPDHGGASAGIILSPDGNSLLSVGYRAIWVDMSGSVPSQITTQLAGNAEYIAASPVGSIAVTGSSMMHEMTAIYDYSLAGHARLNYSRPGINPEADLPKHLAMSGNGEWLVSADLTSDSVSVFDVAGGTVLDCIDVGDQPYWVAITQDGTLALSCDYESSQVSLIDVINRTVLTTMPSQTRAGNAVFSPDQTRAYAVSVGANPVDYLSVYNINGASSSLVTHISLTLNLYGFYYNGGWVPNPAISADGTTIVVPGANPSAKSAVVIDTNLLAVQAVVDLSSTPGIPWFAAINPAGDRACVVDGQGHMIHFIQLAGPASSLLHSMSPGQNPFNAIYSDDGTYVYINNRDSDNLVVIDTATYAIVRTVSLPGEPEHMTASGSTLFVMCAVNSPNNPTINTVSMDGPSSALTATYEKDYYGFFIAGHESPEFAMTNCAGFDRYSFLHDPAAQPTATATPGPIPATTGAGLGFLLITFGTLMGISLIRRK